MNICSARIFSDVFRHNVWFLSCDKLSKCLIVQLRLSVLGLKQTESLKADSALLYHALSLQQFNCLSP